MFKINRDKNQNIVNYILVDNKIINLYKIYKCNSYLKDILNKKLLAISIFWSDFIDHNISISSLDGDKNIKVSPSNVLNDIINQNNNFIYKNIDIDMNYDDLLYLYKSAYVSSNKVFDLIDNRNYSLHYSLLNEGNEKKSDIILINDLFSYKDYDEIVVEETSEEEINSVSDEFIKKYMEETVIKIFAFKTLK